MKLCPSCGARYEDAAKFCQHDGTLLRQTGMSSDEDPYVGQILLGQFEIKEVIGEGGMGRVYRAHQHGFDRPVAIKILHTDLVTNQEMVQRFNREAKIISRLDHPGIIHVYLFGELPDGNLYLAMEYVDGHGLTDLINEGPTPVPQTVHIGRQILSALTEAHRKGVVHRDLKPDNIMLVNRPDDPDTVKVLDFGIAKFLGSRTMLTQQGLVFGSARYISPEAAAGEIVDERADLYAVGVILYQMLAGKPPFNDSSAVALLMRHVNDPPPYLLDQPGARHVPEPIAQVVMQALVKDPSCRFDGAAAMRTALTEAARRSGMSFGGIEGAKVGWSAAPPSNGIAEESNRGEKSRTNPMFGGAITGAVSKAYTEAKNQTAPLGYEASSTQSAVFEESDPVSSSEPLLPYGDPNDDEILIPRPRSWGVIIVIIILVLTGTALGALIALGTGYEQPPQQDTGPPELQSPVSLGLNQPVAKNATPEPSDQQIPDTQPLKQQLSAKNPTSPVTQNTVDQQSLQKRNTKASRNTKRSEDENVALSRRRGKMSPNRGGMPPAVTLSLEPRRPLVGQKVLINAKVSPSSTLDAPRFVISNRNGDSSWRDAQATRSGIYSTSMRFEQAGSYQITFVAKSRHGEVRAFSDAVVSAKQRASPTKQPENNPEQRPVATDDSERKPPDHEQGPPQLLEPWSTPDPW